MPTPQSHLSRRALLGQLVRQAAPAAPPPRPVEPRDRTLVVVFLRGAADGLNMVVPHFEDRYASLRPTLALSRDETEDLDGRFGLHPALAPLLPLYRQERLAILHAVGSDDQTRSHFEAQDLMEHGGRHEEGVAGGWVARHLRASGDGSVSPLGAVALSATLPESLRGTPAVALASLAEVTLGPRSSNRKLMRDTLATLYGTAEGEIAATGQATLEMLDRLGELGERARGGSPGQNSGGAGTGSDGGTGSDSGTGSDGGSTQTTAAAYPQGRFARALADTATLIHAGVGLRAACIDLDGWDTHFFQGAAGGLQAGRMTELAGGLAAFCADLGARLDDTLIVVQTEFGRRAYENASLGTDHGRASVMFALGANVHGGRILGERPGLAEGDLEDPGDLRVTTDYRSALAEILDRSLGNPKLDQVFPGHTPTYPGLVRGG